MPESVLTQRRQWVAILAVLAMVASLMAIARPAEAVIATDNACPATIPSAGFTDIGGLSADAQAAIDCLAHYDITQGTSATTFSPFAAVPRWQMALFLIRSASAMDVSLPSGADQGFTDIDDLSSSAIIAINQLKQLGVTQGTSATTFSPFQTVPRWQMALFLTRLYDIASNTLPSGADQGFTDLGGTSGAAKIAINQLVQLDISEGTSATTFSPLALVARWQMALFLTRTLEADGVTPTGIQVSVTPADASTLGTGQSRTFVATFTNTDGSPYTARIGLELLDTTSGDAPIYNNKAENVTFSATTDGLAGVGSMELNGFPGTNGQVTFTITNNGTAEQVVVVAWEDENANDGYSSGNAAPTEPFALSGVTDFVSGAAAEADSGTYTFAGASPDGVTKTTKADDVFEARDTAPVDCGNGNAVACSFFYDANDVFTVDGAAATLQDFEDALSVDDDVTVTYNDDPAGQSTFALTDVVAPLTVTTPSSATTVDAATFAISGAADPGATVRVKVDLNNDGDSDDAGEGTVATGTATVDGAWTATVSLTQNAANNFIVTQVPDGGVETPAAPGGIDVPTITEGANVAAKMATSTATNGGTAGILDPGDTIVVDFNEDITGVGNGDTLSIVDIDGSSATLTCGTDVTCTVDADNDTLTLVINAVVFASGGTTGGIQAPAQFTAVSGFTGDDGLAINVAGSGSGRVFGDNNPVGDAF